VYQQKRGKNPKDKREKELRRHDVAASPSDQTLAANSDRTEGEDGQQGHDEQNMAFRENLWVTVD